MTRPDLSAALARLLGIPATRGDLAPEARGSLELGPVVVEKWLLTAEAGSRLPLTLYRPRDVAGPLPAVVQTCGHGDSKGVQHIAYVAQLYARAGVICAVADPLGEEERHATGGIGTRAHDAPDVAYRAELIGRPVMGKFVFDAMRTLDFLATRTDVDATRLGVIGNSLGGAIAAWLFALEPRLRLTIVSGWALSDALCRTSKHCTRVPNHKLRAVCDWPAFLRLGPGALLFANGDADVVIDHDLSGHVWRDTAAHLAAADPGGQRLRTWCCPGGGHRPYQGYRDALRVVQQHLGTPLLTPAALDTLPEVVYGEWCDRYGVALEKLYGVPLHYRGARLPDLGLTPIPRERLAVLQPSEVGTADFTIDGWLAAHGG